ncbi:MAG: protease HtpX, partial [Geminicoccaceae bacterium]
WLASALELIDRQAKGMSNPLAQENPAAAHLFIINPLRSGGISGLFRTHPPTSERVRRLTNMDKGSPGATKKRPWD